MAKKSKENELKNIQKKIKKLQYAFGNIEKEHWEELETLFDKIENNKDLEENIETLKARRDLLYEISKVIKLKEKQLEQLELDLEKQDLYIRKQYIQHQKNCFRRIIIVLLILIVTGFLAYLAPAIKERIDYNPHVTVCKKRMECDKHIFPNQKETVKNDK